MNKKLSTKQERTLMALLTEPTIAQAAQVAGVTERTVYNWMKDDLCFKNEFRLKRQQLMQTSISKLQRASEKAVGVLEEILNNAEISPSVRMNAARTILEMGLRALEIDDLDARISALEGVLKNGEPRTQNQGSRITTGK